jgi:hypothetical protein
MIESIKITTIEIGVTKRYYDRNKIEKVLLIKLFIYQLLNHCWTIGFYPINH